MILGTGIDAVSIQRAKKLQGRVLQKIFNASELAEYEALANAHEDIRAQFLASRFAVKEAYAKARGTGFNSVVIPNEIITRKATSVLAWNFTSLTCVRAWFLRASFFRRSSSYFHLP